MKKIKVSLIVIFVLIAASFSQQLAAQEKSKTEQEKEYQLQKVIEEQKKALTEQKKKIDELVSEGSLSEKDSRLELIEQQEKLNDMMNDINVNVETIDKLGGAVRIYSPRGDRSFRFSDPYVVSSDYEGYFGKSFGSDSERTTWDLSKSVKENTFSSTYPFIVEKTAKNVVMSVMGDCKAGEIRIKIIMPNGKNYSDIVIDEFGNLNWRKSFTISDTENQDKTGEWKFQIVSTKATGYFKIALQTY